MKYKYSAIAKENEAKVVGKDLGISLKSTIMIGNSIRGRKISFAKDLMRDVMDKKKAIKYTKFNMDLAHKPGIGPGRYPIKASEGILGLLESVESNALFKGLNTQNLVISHFCAKKAATPWHYGRQRRRKMKRIHVEIIVKEQEKKKDEVKKK